jgi:uncharacterized protein YyaL (SSP411 family)
VKYLKHAIDLSDYFISRFHDRERGGFFFTPDGGENLLVRKRETYDGAVPSSNSVAMVNLIRLARITGRTELEKYAEDSVIAFSDAVAKMPSAHTFMMCALEFFTGPSCEVVITGIQDGTDTAEMINKLNRKYYPNRVTIFRPAEESTEIDKFAEYLKEYRCIDSGATAYVCRNNSCAAPVTDPEEMLELID